MTTKRSKPPVPAVGDAWEGHFDEILPYSTRGMKERLKPFANDPSFAADFVEAVGGVLLPEHGGSWERMRKASFFLEGREERPRLDDRKRFVSRIKALDYDDRQLVELYGRVAGIRKTYDSPAVTVGEVTYLSRIADWVEIADITDVVECISTAFPGTEDISPSRADDVTGPPGDVGEGTPEAGTTSPASGEITDEPPRKTVRVLEDDLVIPDGYLHGVDLDGTVAEIKERLLTHLHAHLVAEISGTNGGKNRKSLTDWMISKLKGFKVPDEMRAKEES